MSERRLWELEFSFGRALTLQALTTARRRWQKVGRVFNCV